MTQVRLGPTALLSRVKHSTTEPLASLNTVFILNIRHLYYPQYCKIPTSPFYCLMKCLQGCDGMANTVKSRLSERRLSETHWVIRRRWTVPTFFSIIYCNKTTNYSNFDYPKNSIFRSDSSVPLKKLLINYPSRFEVQKSRMVIMISLFGRVRFTHLSDLANKFATGN